MISIFDYKSYRKFLKDWLREQPRRGHGEKKRLASAIQVQATFLSQVLSGTSDLSMEQAMLATKHFRFSKPDTEFFLLLVQKERSGNALLTSHLAAQIADILKERQTVAKRLQKENSPDTFAHQEYFSSWMYPAIHLLSRQSAYSSSQSLAKALQVSEDAVVKVLGFLVQQGVIQRDGDRLNAGTRTFHLSLDSAYLNSYRMQMRTKGMAEIQNKNPGLFYSSIHTVDRADFDRIRELLLKCITEVDAKIEASGERELCVINIDHFEIGCPG